MVNAAGLGSGGGMRQQMVVTQSAQMQQQVGAVQVKQGHNTQAHNSRVSRSCVV